MDAPQVATTEGLKHLRLAILDYGAVMHPVAAAAADVLGLRPIKKLNSADKTFSALLSTAPPHILLVHWAPPDRRPLKLCKAIRTPRSSPRPFLPLIAICAQVTKAHVLAARDAGVDEFLAAPFTAKALGERLLAVVEQRRGFVDVPGYFGPDRRRGAMADFLGANRRSGNDQLIDPETGKVYLS